MIKLEVQKDTEKEFLADVIRQDDNNQIRKLGVLALNVSKDGRSESGTLTITEKLNFDTIKQLDELRQLFDAIYDYEGGGKYTAKSSYLG